MLDFLQLTQDYYSNGYVGGMGFSSGGSLLLMGAIAILGYIVQARLQSVFAKYSQVPFPNGMTGAEVAEKMLRDNNVHNVKITHVAGQLTDHFNPANMTVNLSDSVYSSRSIAAAAVACHECGHAIQHARGYAPLVMRSALVPVVRIACRNVGDYRRYRNYGLDELYDGMLDRYRYDCYVGTLLYNHSACGVQRFAARFGVAGVEPHIAGCAVGLCPRIAPLGRKNLSCSGFERHCDSDLLHLDDFAPQQLKQKIFSPLTHSRKNGSTKRRLHLARMAACGGHADDVGYYQFYTSR